MEGTNNVESDGCFSRLDASVQHFAVPGLSDNVWEWQNTNR